MWPKKKPHTVLAAAVRGLAEGYYYISNIIYVGLLLMSFS